MENEKKKRHKKKKNKQGKTSTSSGVGESTSENNNNSNVTNQNHQNLNSDSSDVPKRGLQQTVMDSDRESISGAETTSVEQKIKDLQEQLDMHVKIGADHERNILQLQKERNIWHHKETELEALISDLQTEKHSRVQKEKIAAETIASLNKDNAKLRAQVIELEMSINNISQQNQQLKELASELHSKIQDLESSVTTSLSSENTKHVVEYEDMNSQLESAQALVAKLFSEKEKLVEKVNTLETKFVDQKTTTTTTQSSSLIKSVDPIFQNPKPADMDETSTTETDPTPSSSEELDTVSNAGPQLVNHMNNISQVDMESGEIVQISLNENDVTGGEPVPLTDAPLIGAPFRLISFVARYVSGADLVQK